MVKNSKYTAGNSFLQKFTIIVFYQYNTNDNYDEIKSDLFDILRNFILCKKYIFVMFDWTEIGGVCKSNNTTEVLPIHIFFHLTF